METRFKLTDLLSFQRKTDTCGRGVEVGIGKKESIGFLLTGVQRMKLNVFAVNTNKEYLCTYSISL